MIKKEIPALSWLFATAFFACTLDLVLKVEFGGFTLKLYHLLFLALFGVVTTASARLQWKGLTEAIGPLQAGFAICMTALALLYLGLAPWSAFPLKSLLYSCWLLFDVFVVWLSIQYVARSLPRGLVYRTIWVSLILLSSIILIDQVAYQLGYEGGLIGFNQDAITKLGISRPHAFASEPSVAASFLCLGLLSSVIPVYRASRRKWLAIAGAGLVTLALITTTSRTGWFSLVLGVGLLLALFFMERKKIAWGALGAVLLALPILSGIFYLTIPRSQQSALNEKLVSSLLKGQDSSGNSRARAHVLAFEMARATHWVGTGLGASYRYFKEHGGFDYSFPAAFDQRMYGNEVIMSTWGQLLAEGGIPAVLLFLLAAFFLTRDLYRGWQREGSDTLAGPLVAAVVFFGFIAFCLGNVCRGDVWVWYGIWSALAAAPQETRAAS